MSIRLDKETGDLVLGGWENGVAPSPEKGVANLQCVNVNTDIGEVMSNMARVTAIQPTIVSGTVSADNASHLTYIGSPALQPGAVILVASSSITNFSTGTYWVVAVSGTTIQVTTAYGGTAIGNLGLTGTATFSTVGTSSISSGTYGFVASTAETYLASGITNYRYYILDAVGILWVFDTNSGYTVFSIASNSTDIGNSFSPSGLIVLNGFALMFSLDHAYYKETVLLGDSWVSTTFNLSQAFQSNQSHFAYVSHANFAYICDGNNIA